MITREQVLANSLIYFGQLNYSQSKRAPDGYRQDCSGYISRCWQTAKSGSGTWGGYSTSTLVTHGVMYQIDWSDLRPGDAIGRCGPGTDSSGAGNGHVMLWLGKEGSRHRIRDHGSGVGPKERLVSPPSDYKAYRFVNILDEVAKMDPDKFPLQPGHYFGNISGPTESHGGGVVSDIPYIRAIQSRLEELGFELGFIDGEFGPATEGAVKAFQASRSIEVDGKVGSVTWKELFSSVTVPVPPSSPPETGDPILSVLLRIQSGVNELLARPPVVAHVDTSSLVESLTDILNQLDDPDITIEQIVEAVKQAFREGSQ